MTTTPHLAGPMKRGPVLHEATSWRTEFDRAFIVAASVRNRVARFRRHRADAAPGFHDPDHRSR